MQSDVVTREQALGCGLSQHVVDRLLHAGSWRRLCPGLYLTVPIPPPFASLAWGGVLIGGPHSRLGPEASGHIWQIIERAPETVDVLVPAERTLADRDHWRSIRERPTARSGRSRGNPPRLNPEDTVLDLAAARSEGDVVGLVTRAVGSRLTTPDRLRQHLDRRARHPHRRLLRDLLTDVADGAHSPLELRYVRDVERPHDLPRGDPAELTARTALLLRRPLPTVRAAGGARRSGRSHRDRPLP
jgi:putative AbiEi antitoxin of type IV toxin-antitoxin system